MMPFQRNNTLWRMSLFVGVILVCLFAFGCSPTDRYHVLTIFFDGVPPPAEHGAAAKGALPIEPDEDKMIHDTTSPPAPRKFQHGPYAAQLCDGCHNKSSNAKNRLATFTLKMDKRKLCVFCHEDKRPENLLKKFKWVHGPVQFGECLACHNPHESANEFMLKLWPVKKQCYFCHDEERIVRTEIHAALGENDCIPCHNAHAK